MPASKCCQCTLVRNGALRVVEIVQAPLRWSFVTEFQFPGCIKVFHDTSYLMVQAIFTNAAQVYPCPLPRHTNEKTVSGVNVFFFFTHSIQTDNVHHISFIPLGTVDAAHRDGIREGEDLSMS